MIGNAFLGLNCRRLYAISVTGLLVRKIQWLTQKMSYVRGVNLGFLGKLLQEASCLNHWEICLEELEQLGSNIVCDIWLELSIF